GRPIADRATERAMIRRRRGNAPLLGEQAVNEGEELGIDHLRRLGFLCRFVPGKGRQNVVAGASDELVPKKSAQRVDDAGFPVDRGAEWLHSADRNPLSQIAKHLGFLVHGRPPEWTTRLRRSGETVEAEADWIATREAQSRARRKAAAEPVDCSLASLLVPGERWNDLLDATSTWGNGAELDRVSVK